MNRASHEAEERKGEFMGAGTASVATEVPVPSGPSNTCCVELKRKYDEAKVSLKQAMNIVERQQNAIKEEKMKAKLEKEAKKKETAVRKTLENDIRELKAQIASLSQEAKNQLVVDKSGDELERIKLLLEEEKKRTISEKTNAANAWDLLRIEKDKVEEERQLLQKEQARANQLSASLAKVKREFEESRNQLAKKVEEEKQKANREKRRADTEKAKLEEEKKRVEREKKRVLEEENRAKSLLKKLEEEREKANNLSMKLEEERKQNQCLTDNLAVERAQRQKDVVFIGKEDLNVKLLREKLKLRKAQLKHEKRILKLEKSKNDVITQELSLLRHDFIQLSSRFKVLDSLLDIGGTRDFTKIFLTHSKPVAPLMVGNDRHVSLREGGDQHMLRQSQSRPLSGTSSESLLPNQQNFTFNSDKKFLVSTQEREKDASVSSPPLLKHQKKTEACTKSTVETLNINRKRKRKENTNPMRKVIRKVNNQANSEVVEFEKVVREGGVLKLLEFEDEDLERKFRSAMDGFLSPALPQIVPRENVKVSDEGNITNKEGKDEDYHSLSRYDFKSRLNLKETIRADEEKHEMSQCLNKDGRALKGGNEKHSHYFLIVFSNLSEKGIKRVRKIWNEITCQKSVCQGIDLSARVLQLAANSEFLSEDKIYVICSLLASEVCRVLMSHSVDVSNFYFDKDISSLAGEACSVLSEDMLQIFIENDVLENTACLFKDFLVFKQVHVYKNGNFYLTNSTKCQLISCCISFALICAKTSQLDLIRGTTYTILLEGKRDISNALISAHIFASICGERFFGNNEERLLENALRWVVYHSEKNGIQDLGLEPCQRCPFNMETADAELFVGSLLDELEACSLLMNRESDFVCDRPYSTCIAEKNGLCYFREIISLLELVGVYMAWECVFNKVVPRLWRILESCGNEELAASIVVLIGQLSRSVLDEGGYKQIQVSGLREKLSNFIKVKDKIGLALQFACMSTLLNLIPLNVNQILMEDISSDNEQFCPEICQIKSWFSGLSKEQKCAFQSLFRG